jgi:hypothetical protein
VAKANVVPRSGWSPDEANGDPSPEDATLITPRVSEKIEPDEDEEEEEMPFRSIIRSTGLVDIELRRTHFQSSLISAPEFGDE